MQYQLITRLCLEFPPCLDRSSLQQQWFFFQPLVVYQKISPISAPLSLPGPLLSDSQLLGSSTIRTPSSYHLMSIASMTISPAPWRPTILQHLVSVCIPQVPQPTNNKELPHIQRMANGLFLLQDFDNNFHAMVLASKINKNHLYSSSFISSQVKLTGLFLRTLQLDHRFHFSRNSRLKITDLQLPVLVGWKTNTSNDRPHHIQQLSKKLKENERVDLGTQSNWKFGSHDFLFQFSVIFRWSSR